MQMGKMWSAVATVNCFHMVKNSQNFCQQLGVNPALHNFTGIQNDVIVAEDATEGNSVSEIYVKTWQWRDTRGRGRQC